ncbi:unnamed protein product [Lactuca saligna]|uniref:Uncharacterized protein n=1 Tax=Lactuca saligna TaxID=75948 RepID=A0AA35YJX1_LACSI|nr:unnamed protein product [Lactuca saligna]
MKGIEKLMGGNRQKAVHTGISYSYLPFAVARVKRGPENPAVHGNWCNGILVTMDNQSKSKAKSKTLAVSLPWSLFNSFPWDAVILFSSSSSPIKLKNAPILYLLSEKALKAK